MAPVRALEPEEHSAAQTDAAEAPLTGTWPHALSHEPLLRVSDVLRLVQPEFPALTTSKLRFLDGHGLVTPHRTPSGYRQYSPAEVERLRFVLRQQRDHYRPLTVIADHLDALDKGRMHEAVGPHAIDGPHHEYVSADEAAQQAGIDTSLVADLEHEGLIHQASPGRFRRDVIPLMVAAGAYVRAGGDVRSLRTVRNAAVRESDRALATAAPHRSRGDQGHADAVAEQWAEAAIAVFSAYVRHGVAP